MKKFLNKLFLVALLILPFRAVFAYQRVSTEEYKEFLRKFLEEKYYINTDEDGSNSASGICGVTSTDATCNGVTVSSVGSTYDLDTYVAGVLYAEPGGTIDNDELGKAWAIIIRSFTVAHTNNCTNSITASSNEQNFNSAGIETYKKYADETSGIVMMQDGEIIEAVYSLATASDCILVDGNKCKFKRCTVYADSVSSCTGEVTEFIVPSGTITYPYGDIHYGGIEPYIAQYLSNNEGYTYDQLLQAFYGSNIQLAKLGGSSSSSSDSSDSSDTTMTLSCNEDSGEMVTADGVSFPVKYYDNFTGNTSISELQNNEYFANAGSNISQCPWYAKARALEIVNTSTLSDDLKSKATAVLNQTWGNGVDWYGGVNSTLGSYFAYTSDITKPKAGSIVAWSGGNGHNYGHVGIIEKVNDDGTVVMSDGWNASGADGTDSWSNVVVQTTTMTLDELQYYTNHVFEGYTYLFSYRK